MEHLTCSGRRYVSTDHTKSHKAAAARRLAAAQQKWSSQHHTGARVHPAFCKRVYLSRLTASDFFDSVFLSAPTRCARVRIMRSGRVSNRRSTMRGTLVLRDARVNLLLRFHVSATCNYPFLAFGVYRFRYLLILCLFLVSSRFMSYLLLYGRAARCPA